MYRFYILSIPTVMLLAISGCTTIKYVPKVHYVYTSCKKTVPIKENTYPSLVQKESSEEQVDVEEPIKEVVIPPKYRKPQPTTIFAPQKYIIKENKKMNFMLGINKNGSKFIYMEGAFGVDTFTNFKKFLLENDTTIKELKINSNGGLVSPAMEIGSYVYSHRWNTGVDKEMRCMSACGFVYFAGRKKSLEGEAIVGLHRPYRPGVVDTVNSIREVKKAYISYWNHIHAPKSIYDEMMEVPRDELFILDKQNINDYIDVEINE